jgi:hypothetical protein
MDSWALRIEEEGVTHDQSEGRLNVMLPTSKVAGACACADV